MYKSLLPFITLVALSLSSFPAFSIDPVPDIHSASIGGYSPVSYFTKGEAERGSKEYAVAHKGMVYYLASEEQVSLFNENPDKYRPRYSVCPFSLTKGKKMALDPTNFKVVGDHLLLFHKSKGINGLSGWNQSKLTDKELIERADKEYVLFRF